MLNLCMWGTLEPAAFEEMKTLISNDQLQAFYDVHKPIVIQCDASTKGLRATLLQDGWPVELQCHDRCLRAGVSSYSLCLPATESVHIWKESKN